MRNYHSNSLDDLLLSSETAELIRHLGLTNALHHVRAVGTQHGQKLRNIGICNRDTVSLMEVCVTSKARPPVASVLLIEDDWKVLAEQTGGDHALAAHSIQFAIGEIEGRLRHDPELAKLPLPPQNPNRLAPPAPAATRAPIGSAAVAVPAPGTALPAPGTGPTHVNGVEVATARSSAVPDPEVENAQGGEPIFRERVDLDEPGIPGGDGQ